MKNKVFFTDVRKLFILVWIPILFLSTYGVVASLDRPIMGDAKFNEDLTEVIDYDLRSRNWGDLVPAFVFLGVMTVALVVLVDLPDVKNDNVGSGGKYFSK